jgi:predicted lipoprotein
MQLKPYLLLLLLTPLLCTCGGTRENDPVEAAEDSLDKATETAVDKKIIPTVDAFSVQANQFSAQSVAFCDSSDENTLNALQAQWKSLSSQWYKLEIYRFGPLNDDLIFPKINFIDSLRLNGRNYVDTVRTEISKNIASADTLDEDFFDKQVFKNVGLLALESLSFETAASEHSKLPADIVAEYKNLPRKCEVLKGLSNQLVKHANYVQNGWNNDHKASGKPFRDLFISNQLEDGTPALTRLIASTQEHLDYLQKRNVATTAAQISEHSWDNITASIDEVEQLLAGVNESDLSYFDLMSSGGFQNSVGTVKENITRVRQDIQNKDAAALKVSLGKLDGNFKREIPDGLAVQLGINFIDGD